MEIVDHTTPIGTREIMTHHATGYVGSCRIERPRKRHHCWNCGKWTNKSGIRMSDVESVDEFYDWNEDEDDRPRYRYNCKYCDDGEMKKLATSLGVSIPFTYHIYWCDGECIKSLDPPKKFVCPRCYPEDIKEPA